MARLSPFRIAHLKRIADPMQPDSHNGRGFSPDDIAWLEDRGYITCATYNHQATGGKHYILTPKGTAALLIDATKWLAIR